MFRVVGDHTNRDNFDCDLDIQLFRDRDIFLDCRGRVEIGQNVTLGYGVKIITTSHNISNMDEVVSRPVIVRKNAFIGSFSVLYNCEIGEGALVACGSVVRNMKVPPHAIVEGNPAQIIGEIKDGVKLIYGKF